MHNYIYPPRPKTSVPRTETNTSQSYWGNLGFVAQFKYNGTRTGIYTNTTNSPAHFEFLSRHKSTLSYQPPADLLRQLDVVFELLGLDKSKDNVIDCELLHSKHRAVKDTLVIYDILVRDGEHLVGTTYKERYDFLHSSHIKDRWMFNGHDLAVCLQPNVMLARSYGPADWSIMWDKIDAVNKPFDQPFLEGVVLKRPTSKLEYGFIEDNNSHWMVRSRVETGRHQF